MQQLSAIKRVLFVDDSLAYLEFTRQGLTPLSRGQWELVLTHDTEEAFAILDSQHIDLLVSDLVMTPMDGMQFLKLAHKRHPHIRKAMLTAYEEAQMCRPALMEACDVYLLKPHTPSGFDTVFHTLNRLFTVQQEGFRGLLRQVSLTDLIQLECINGRSSVLEVAFRNLTARVFIERGRIMHAEAGSKTGPAAFSRLMKMKGGDFRLKEFVQPGQRTIDTSWEHLLLEAAQAADEAGDLEEFGSFPTRPVAVDTSWLLKSPAAAPPEASERGGNRAAAIGGVSPNATPSMARRPRPAEVLVLDAARKSILEWKCAFPEKRLRLLRNLNEICGGFCKRLSMGEPARVELQQPKGRGVANFEPSGWTFCRTEYLDHQDLPGRNPSLEVAHA